MDQAARADKTKAARRTFFHVHLVSDSTGETLSTLLKSVAARFPSAKPLEHVASLVRSHTQLDSVLARIEQAPGLVMYTVVDPGMRRRLEVKCAELQVPAISCLDPLLNAFADYLGLEQTRQAGMQHELDEDYFRRIGAIDFTLAHDDGQNTWNLEAADVVLVGVSRTSKTPTCMYLANKGIKAANVPLVPGVDPPPELEKLRKPLVVGLTANPDRLAAIRTSRLSNLGSEDRAQSYTDGAAVRDEVTKAKRLFVKNGWPMIDVTKRSVEETAAKILTLLSIRRGGEG
ncbi:pyruvate, water dikinase regulatory protein [Parvularcula lutaonensis]|uniref:Putative pyruvate, phosphate dikinase regulatory protein n=1 Tax=Parvularcula lutaonensis TaxID=491923 RepID=A0ABV7MB16_9PROT|nr:pyruvate, water dikinase regulatory protein [Parvularcula lutaonensis]GGY46496.1 putative pyruvate, phosphate dikinase regulatory protein [Parvularcula lutaonensis]